MTMAILLRRWLIVFVGLALLAWGGAALAARSFSYTQSPAPGTAFSMGTTQALSYTITNTATGSNAGERIYEVRFRISSGSTFAASTAAPAGWTRTAYSATSVTFRATSWATALAVGASATFTLQIAMRSTTADVTESLRDIRARNTLTTTGPPFTRLGGGTTVNTPGSWVLRSLAITSFQITDLTGTPITSITAGQSFLLVMTVKNNSSVTQSTIVSNPNPPTAVKTGTVTQSLTSTVGSPLSLTSGSSGTITFTYSTSATDNGTIYFTANARNGPNVTSTPATSGILAIGRFTASITIAPSCQYAGSNITVTMALTNAYPYTILNVTPTLTPVAGSPITYVSGPTPAAPIASVAISPPSTNISWTYLVNATGTTNPFTFSGSATGTGNTGGSPVHTSPTATSASVTRGDFTTTIDPNVVNAGSTNIELAVTVVNIGCAAVNSVGITAPAGWAASGDAYSLVSLNATTAVETWTSAGGVFTAPNLASQMPLTYYGSFAVVYSATPAAAGASIFTIRVTDANGIFVDIPVTVTVNAYLSGSLNDAATRVWREEFR